VSDAIASVSVNDAVRIECAAHETKEAFVE
jgi:hypothetical protein